MIEIVEERRVNAPPAAVWKLVDDIGRYAEWFSFAERMEPLAGEGLGRRQRLHGRWGKKRSEVDQTIVTYDPERELGWRHDAERLDGKPAPVFAKETRFTIRLVPDGEGTIVRMESRQVPASPAKGLVMKAFGTREVRGHLRRSLQRLAELAERG